MRKPVFGVSEVVRHKPGCAVTADGQRLENSDLESRGIVLSVYIANTKALISFAVTAKLICGVFVFVIQKAGFLTKRLKCSICILLSSLKYFVLSFCIFGHNVGFIECVCFLYIKYNIEIMSRVVRKPAFCICENKDADQLRGYSEADQRLCFRYTDSTIPLLLKYEISSL